MKGTLQSLGLTQQLHERQGQVYGLSKSPVAVMGDARMEGNVGDGQQVDQTFEVLESEEQVLILGRYFLSRFNSVEFDWGSCRICFG